ncbi:MAG: HYR domain-containing protein, partial [Bacteroidota bacterium]
TTADNCSVASVTNNAPAAFPLGTTTVTWTVTDGSGNTATATQSVTVTDNVNPTITAPAGKNVTTNTGCTATGVSLGTPTTADNCSVASVTNNAPSAFPLGTTTVTWTVTDGSGNTATATQTVTVSDNVNPSITAPAAVSANTNSGCTATGVSLGTPTTSDNCSVASVANNAPSAFPVGTTTVTWTVTDGSGNTSTATQTVTVTDNVPPTAVCQNITLNLNASGNASITASQVNNGSSDNCGIASVTVSQTSFTCANVGANTVTLTVTDVNGNVSSCTATVTIVDNIAPTAVCQNISVYLNALGTASITASQINNGSSDNCGIASLSLSKTSFNCSNVGNNAVTLTVTDVNGNSSTCSATVTVTDNIAPAISCPANITANNTTGLCGAIINYTTPIGTDICGATTVQTAGLPSGSLFPVGTTVNTFTVTDPSGNQTSCSFSVSITDTQGPVFSNVPANFSACNPVSWIVPTVTDNCAGVQVTSSHVPGTAFPSGTTTVSYTATDVYGLTST